MSALVVEAGQSNAGVYHLSPEDLPGDVYAITPLVQIWTTNGFAPLQPGVNTGLPNYPDCWGPEVGYASAWLGEHAGETLYIVKSVKGSTSLVSGVASNWSPEQPPNPDGSPNGMFNKTTTLVQAARAATGLPVSDVLWMQGEEDATDAAAAAAYRDHLTDLFAHMRTDWGADQIILGEISSRSSFPYGDQVRAAQVAVADANRRAILINLDQLALQADGIHLAAASALALGRAFYVGAALERLLQDRGVAVVQEPCLAALP